MREENLKKRSRKENTYIIIICFLIGTSSYFYMLNLSIQPKINQLITENESLKGQLKTLQRNYNILKMNNTILINKYDKLKTEYYTLKFEYAQIFNKTPEKTIPTTIVYYTNFGEKKNILTIIISYETYEKYHEEKHPIITPYNLEVAKQYITSNDPIIKQIAEKLREQTVNEEELADALLDFVQDKNYALSIRYYPTIEFKYPVETLVEMGGDCDTHAFLYASLLKAAGFKTLLLFTTDQTHVAVAVHLNKPPEHNLNKIAYYFEYNGLKYYFAETTSWGWRVGDLPSELENKKWKLIEV
ncbi:MAG: hypothetical protein DRJ30_02905 [Candidatus Methanomethylicota archaeon]|nr:MAG: hypothetical protein DRJ30_02905 [Candidatus Verstraetearchaeota archaeon]